MIAIRSTAAAALAASLVALAVTTLHTPTAERALAIVPSAGNRPVLVAYRPEGARDWTMLQASARGYVVRAPAKRFTVVVACPELDERGLVQFFHLAAQDTDMLPVDCRSDERTRIHTHVRFVDPARELWVGNAHAGVRVDKDDRIVDRNDSVELAPGLYDWIVMTAKPFRIAITHDAAASPTPRELGLAGGAPVDRIRVAAPNSSFISVEFHSRNGTRFSGLGEPEPGVLEIVPRKLRKPGDFDVVHAERSTDAGGVVGVSRGYADPPQRITLAMPTATPSSRVVEREMTWRGAPKVDLVTIDYTDALLTWQVTASARWLDGKTSYTPIDPGSIPGWRWARTAPRASWITWLWTDDAIHLPFDAFTPPSGVTFARVAEFLQ